jgi:hypothetical protein
VQTAYSTLLSNPANASNAAVQMLQQGMPASTFKVAGGVTYLGQRYSNWTSGTNRFLPNVGLVYQINSKTVLPGRTGWSSDTYSSMNSHPGTNGYNQQTSTILTNDNALTYCCAANSGSMAASALGAANPLMNPFPILAALPAIQATNPIWYQGESIVGGDHGVTLYPHVMEAMVKTWHKLWGEGDFRLYAVPLPALQNIGGNSGTGGQNVPRSGRPSKAPQLTPAPLARTSPSSTARPGEKCWPASMRTPRRNIERPATSPRRRFLNPITGSSDSAR